MKSHALKMKTTRTKKHRGTRVTQFSTFSSIESPFIYCLNFWFTVSFSLDVHLYLAMYLQIDIMKLRAKKDT